MKPQFIAMLFEKFCDELETKLKIKFLFCGCRCKIEEIENLNEKTRFNAKIIHLAPSALDGKDDSTLCQ